MPSTIAAIKIGNKLQVLLEVQVKVSCNGKPVTALTTLRLWIARDAATDAR